MQKERNAYLHMGGQGKWSNEYVYYLYLVESLSYNNMYMCVYLIIVCMLILLQILFLTHPRRHEQFNIMAFILPYLLIVFFYFASFAQYYQFIIPF